MTTAIPGVHIGAPYAPPKVVYNAEELRRGRLRRALVSPRLAAQAATMDALDEHRRQLGERNREAKRRAREDRKKSR